MGNEEKEFEKSNDFLERRKISSNFMTDFSCDNCDTDPTSSDDLTDQHKKFLAMCERELKDELPSNFDQWTGKEQFDHLMSDIGKYFPNIPESLRFVLPATFENGDCGRSPGQKPDWLDMDKFRRGQEFGLRYFNVINISNLLSLLQIFSFEDGLKPLILSQKSNSPYRAFTRYLSTIKRFRNWYTSDPWREGTPAYRDIQMVRKLHGAMRQKLCGMDDEEIDRECEMAYVHCPMLGTIAKDFADSCPMLKSRQCPYTMTRMKGLNQGDMLGTQFASTGMIVLYPEKFGVHANDEDLEAFCHFWRGLGYLLGIKDEYNFCCGTLQEIRKRCNDFIECWVKPNYRVITPEWEHMSTCLFDGVNSIVGVINFKIYLLFLCNILDIKMTRFYMSFNILEKVRYAMLRFLFKLLLRFPNMHFVINMIFHAQIDKASNVLGDKHIT